MMQNFRYNGLIVLKDNLQCSAERLWASLLCDAVKSDKGMVLVCLLTSCKNTLCKRYPFILKSTVVDETDSLYSTFHQRFDLFKYAKETVVFTDSIDKAFLTCPVDQVIAFLHEVSKNAAVIVRVHEECISAENWERLCSVARITYSLKVNEMKKPLCTTVFYKKNGKRAVKVETVHIDDLLHVSFKPYKGEDISISAKESSNLLVPESSFDIGLHLRKSELEAKQHVHLPYEAAQKEEQLVGLNVTGNRKIRIGGRIIYTPDEADDFDESDPDDDLEI